MGGIFYFCYFRYCLTCLGPGTMRKRFLDPEHVGFRLFFINVPLKWHDFIYQNESEMTREYSIILLKPCCLWTNPQMFNIGAQNWTCKQHPRHQNHNPRREWSHPLCGRGTTKWKLMYFILKRCHKHLPNLLRLECLQGFRWLSVKVRSVPNTTSLINYKILRRI